MFLASRIVRLAASPCFLLLALMLHSNADTVLQICGVTRSETTLILLGQTLRVPVGALGSMWAMYLLMAVFHSGPWIGLLSEGVVGRECCESPEVGRVRDTCS